MSNRSNGPKSSVEVLNVNSDYHQVAGERFFRVDIGKQVSVSKSTPPTMAPFPQPNLPYLKYSLTI